MGGGDNTCTRSTHPAIQSDFVDWEAEHAETAEDGDEREFEGQVALRSKPERHGCVHHHAREVRGRHHLHTVGADMVDAVTGPD